MTPHKKPAIIKVENLVKKYGDFTAVKGISFEVYENEIFGLLGPNGAGKTTTLEVIETLRAATDGDVKIYDHSVTENPNAIKMMIGVQLQQSGYYPNLKLTEILELFGNLYNQPIRPMELLAMVNLEEKAAAKYSQLSGGQKQRFSIATTLINKPKIVFLDEPSTGLDPKARRDLWTLIEKIRDQGTTIILTTHYMDEAETLCDRVAIIDAGTIIRIGSPDSLIDRLVASGYKRPREVKKATLEDVFLHLTGKELDNENA
ncbi:ABC transporter ATP-binding protein [Candidatus Berkelbacteria bacterium]|nr:ABC transporter ATP-binding protein [Candidatus Berkelbacteria bacterium]